MCPCLGSGSYRVTRRVDHGFQIVTKPCACPAAYGVGVQREKDVNETAKSVDLRYEDVMRGAKMGGTVYAPKGAPRTPLSKASEALQRHAQRVGL